MLRKLLCLLLCASLFDLSATHRRVRIPIKVRSGRRSKSININLSVHAPSSTKRRDDRDRKKKKKKKPTEVVQKPAVTQPAHIQSDVVNQRLQLMESQIAKLAQDIGHLSALVKGSPMAISEIGNLSAQLFTISQQIDKLYLQSQSQVGPAPSDQQLQALRDQINQLQAEIAIQRGAAQKAPIIVPPPTKITPSDVDYAKDLLSLKSALFAYITADEKLLARYKAFKELFEPAAPFDGCLAQSTQNELSDSWDAYKNAITVLGTVLDTVGMGGKRVEVNPAYKLAIEAALNLDFSGDCPTA